MHLESGEIPTWFKIHHGKQYKQFKEMSSSWGQEEKINALDKTQVIFTFHWRITSLTKLEENHEHDLTTARSMMDKGPIDSLGCNKTIAKDGQTRQKTISK